MRNFNIIEFIFLSCCILLKIEIIVEETPIAWEEGRKHGSSLSLELRDEKNCTCFRLKLSLHQWGA
jgi:hypothetical protein